MAFRWTAGDGMTGLPSPAGIVFNTSIATAISADGSTIVGYGSSGSLTTPTAFRWTSENGTQVLAATALHPNGTATGVSADGSIVVGTVSSGLDAAAFIWDAAHGTRELKDVLRTDYGLDLTGWTLEGAAAVSADGTTIVGTGRNPSGNREAWAVVIPEPAGLTPVLLALIPLSRGARRRTPAGSLKGTGEPKGDGHLFLR